MFLVDQHAHGFGHGMAEVCLKCFLILIRSQIRI